MERIAVLVYPNRIEKINMDNPNFDISKIREQFNKDSEIYRIEFTANGVITDCWEKKVDK